MKNPLKILIVLAAVAYLLFSCAKMNTNLGCKVVIKDNYYASLNFPRPQELMESNYINKLGPAMQTFTINSDTSLTGKEGTSIYIYFDCLRDQSGNPVSGNVTIELLEVFSKKDMVLSNRPSVSNGKILESDGEIYINARQGKMPLQIICDDGISVTLPRQVQAGMELFYGNVKRNDDVNWVKDKALVEGNFANENSDANSNMEGEGDGWNYNPEVQNYYFNTKKFGWINCDRFYEDTREKTELIVKIHNPLPKEYVTHAYVVFKSMNAVMQLYSEDGENYTVKDLPEGEDIAIVVVSGTEMKTFFSSKNNITTKRGANEVLTLEACGKEDIVKKLEALN